MSITAEISGILLVKTKAWKKIEPKDYCYLVRLMKTMKLKTTRAIIKKYIRIHKIDYFEKNMINAKKKLKVN